LGYLFAACYYEGQKCDDKNDIIWSVQLTNYPVAYASKALPEWIDSDLDQTGQFNVNFKALDPSEYVVDQDGLGQYDFRITAAAKYSKATLDWYTFNILLTGATPSR
jgi:hypothetical protein